MWHEFHRIDYTQLNSKQKESFNFQKVSAVLADYGYTTIRLTDDWEGADFIAQHMDGQTFLKVQLKGRLSFAKAYLGKNLYIAFPGEEGWFLYPHDDLYSQIASAGRITGTKSWEPPDGVYHFPNLSKDLKLLLAPYRL